MPQIENARTPTGTIRFCEALAVSVILFEEDQAAQTIRRNSTNMHSQASTAGGVTGSMYHDWQPGVIRPRMPILAHRTCHGPAVGAQLCILVEFRRIV